MVSNDLVVPFVLQRRSRLLTGARGRRRAAATVRRIAIFAILMLAYLYYRSVGEAQLAAIGLLSFAAVAQLAPAFFGGLIWRQGTARGAIGGIMVGILVWAYTLLLPSVADAGFVGPAILTNGPFGLMVPAPAVAVRPRSAAAGAWRVLEPRRSTSSPISASRSVARRRRSSACRPICSCRRAWRRRQASGCGARRSPSRN